MKYLRVFETANERDQVLNMIPYGVISYVENGDVMIHSGIPNNEIHYKSSDGNVVEPSYTDDFGANILSNVYENGIGIITFDGNVTNIGYEAFYDCESLTSITIPESVTSIGSEAFSSCGNITSINIPNSVTSIGMGAFSGLTKILSIDIPTSVESIGENAFEEVKHINYTGNAEDTNENNWGALNRNGIFENGFLYTDSTKTTLVGADITITGNNVIIPNSVTTIGNRAFNGCTSLTSVTMPDSVTSIGNLSFLDCTGLTSITMGNSVTSIEYGALNGCTSLTSITSLNTTPPTLGNSSTLPSHTTYAIYVPAESVDSYKAKQYWSNHASQIQAM
ncbi:MAG: leucine-rich repeat domain-containing protein [Bacteroidaceae bacterium]|nr:leucine-rich repeat domain-containing protein [Bacteroidaceae bacterium]